MFRHGVLVTALAVAGWPVLAADEAGTFKTVRGSVTVEREGKGSPAAPGQKVQVSDRIVTGADSSAGLVLRDGSILTAGPSSVMQLDKFAFNPTTYAGQMDVNLKKGRLAVISGKIDKTDPDAVRFRSSGVTLGVRGTEFVIETLGEE
jgi:hypothetical protein